jgi:hypothetical protein
MQMGRKHACVEAPSDGPHNTGKSIIGKKQPTIVSKVFAHQPRVWYRQHNAESEYRGPARPILELRKQAGESIKSLRIRFVARPPVITLNDEHRAFQNRFPPERDQGRGTAVAQDKYPESDRANQEDRKYLHTKLFRDRTSNDISDRLKPVNTGDPVWKQHL